VQLEEFLTGYKNKLANKIAVKIMCEKSSYLNRSPKAEQGINRINKN